MKPCCHEQKTSKNQDDDFDNIMNRDSETTDESQESIESNNYYGVSDELNDLVTLMTHPEPDKRPTAEALQYHSWIMNNEDDISPEEVCYEMMTRRSHMTRKEWFLWFCKNEEYTIHKKSFDFNSS